MHSLMLSLHWNHTFIMPSSFPFAHPRWIEKHWYALDRQLKQSIVSKDVRVWLQRINFKLSPREIKDYFQMV